MDVDKNVHPTNVDSTRQMKLFRIDPETGKPIEPAIEIK